MNVGADDVRRLLADGDPAATLVAIEGRIEVVSPQELESSDYRGALQLATRQELLQRIGNQTGDAELSDRELAEQAEDLDAALRNLGG
jgi:hypothetical protein